MKASPLVKALLQSSWIASIITAAYAFIFITTFNGTNTPPFVYVFFVGVRFFVQSLINIAILVYINKLMPLAPVRTKKMTRYIACYLLAFIFFFSTAPLESYLSPGGNPKSLLESLSSILIQVVMNNTLVVLIHTLVILRYEKTTTELENTRLRTANLESTNLLLKQQIHPHFLFNALSMLKSLYKADVLAGEKYLSHLVNFLRASLSEPQSRVARLADEIRLCNDYLEMQQIRFECALICNMHIPDHILLRGSVPSFSIQSLIENAIKHNEITELSPLKINVFYKNNNITVENNLQVRKHNDTTSGKGLINLVERYRILSGDEVIILEDSTTFSVTIKVLWNENSDYRG